MPRGGKNYIPRPDGDFTAWANHYYAAMEAFYDEHGFDPALLADLKDALGAWNERYRSHVAARAAAEGARAAKDDARAALEREVRPVTNFVQGYPKTTDADRATIGITVRDTSGTHTPTPTTRPLARVESGNRLTHTLRFTDESTPTRRAKPRGVQGAEVWLALADPHDPPPPLNIGGGTGDVRGGTGVPPVSGSPAPYRFLSLSSRGSLHADFESADAGKTAYYALRWVSTRGEKGPWSEVTTATVAA